MGKLQILKKLNILLVDDHPFIVSTISDLLESSNFQNVTKAYSAEEALTKIKNEQFDLILTDIEMGDMNGLELIKKIRTGKTPAKKNIRIIVLTSHSSMWVLGSAMALDVDGFLAKPMRMDQIINKIEVAIFEKRYIRPAIAYHVIPTEIAEIKAKTENEDYQESASKVMNETVLDEDAEKDKAADDADAAHEVNIEELREGMVISKTIVVESGKVLLGTGHQLTLRNIDRLKEYFDDDTVDTPKVWVYYEEQN